ncbi:MULTISPECIES: nuclear transport factor 2 family protein [unclassified Bradyrhizobium]|uniref:nuclear transport factor 2 family protein n=1 Tax=unclassified Bradyrhizobium TaxID=2631580 RepID=UPI001FFA3DE7|nr:nuclear transport factor 2 family protein [Bradyrhizobium sp. 17]MCK1684859.1 nuclear transport factor 2 family protein [Bradyrhizobium sp. 145]
MLHRRRRLPHPRADRCAAAHGPLSRQAGARRILAHRAGAIRRDRYEVPQIVAEGDTVAAYLRVFFRKRSNDRIIQVDMAVFYTFRRGKVAQIREIIDSYDLVQQVLEREIGPLIVGERVDGG